MYKIMRALLRAAITTTTRRKAGLGARASAAASHIKIYRYGGSTDSTITVPHGTITLWYSSQSVLLLLPLSVGLIK